MMRKEIPAYLYSKNNSIKMIVFTAVFALFFINVFQPFGSRSWYPGVSDFTYFAFSSLIILTGMLVVVVSRIVLMWHARRHAVYYWKFALVILVELIAMALFYSLFTKFVPKDGINRDVLEIFKQSLTNTSLVLLLPYAISWLYFSWKEKSAILDNMEKQPQKDSSPKGLITFPDEKGDLKISIQFEDLLYIEAADNYAVIHYLNKTGTSTFMLRNSLKWIDERYSSETPLTRCHRSYIVNMDRVKVVKKVKGGIMLEIDADKMPDIPVSKTYYNLFMEKFSHYLV